MKIRTILLKQAQVLQGEQELPENQELQTQLRFQKAVPENMSIHLLAVLPGSYVQIHLYTGSSSCTMLLHSKQS